MFDHTSIEIEGLDEKFLTLRREMQTCVELHPVRSKAACTVSSMPTVRISPLLYRIG